MPKEGNFGCICELLFTQCQAIPVPFYLANIFAKKIKKIVCHSQFNFHFVGENTTF
jgi:hypothetical protein